MDRIVTVEGRHKGIVFKDGAARWVWLRNNGGKETFPRSSTLKEVKTMVARLCRVDPSVVEVERIGS